MKIKNLLLLAFIVTLISCKKHKNDTFACDTSLLCNNVNCITFLSNFSFTIVDKTTGADLIFGSNPTLTPADVKLFFNSNPQYGIQKYTDSTKKAFSIISASDTMSLQIKNEPLKLITVKAFCSKGCCSRDAVEIIYDGDLLVADDKGIIRIKR
jgi:hypothetical protein